jgi:hypothetical protein
MRALPRAAIALFLLLHAVPPALAFTDAKLMDGFRRTVLSAEIRVFGWHANVVKKFPGPVRVFVDDRSAARRGGAVERFVRTLPGLIAGLDIKLVARPETANFRILVVDRKDYRATVAQAIDGSAESGFAPGKCLVRMVASDGAITRSDAVVVADSGEHLFRRCIVEETLQGLGPVNDDPTLSESVFNDRSTAETFTDFDRHILNMLYHPLIRPGMTRAELRRVLPGVTAAVQARLK